MTGFLFAFCTCVSLNFNSELFLAPYLMYLSLCVYSRISRVRKRKLLSRILFLLMNDTYDFKSCVALHVRIANHLVEDSCCRGGIVNTRFGCSRARLVRPESQGALAVSCKYFKQSKWPFSAAYTHAHIAIFIKLTLNKIFEYVEMTIFSRPSGSSPNPKAL